MKAIVVLSGGMDSATLAYYVKNKFVCDLIAISFDYGQRHKRELESAAKIAKRLGADHRIVDISAFGKMLKGSALTDDIAVPHGHYEAENMRSTVVPNRNTIMLSMAWGIGCAEGVDIVATGVHAGDHYIYPDCRPEYITALEAALRVGTEGHRKEKMKIYTPFIDSTKTDIARIGRSVHVPFEDTWTCYEGGEKHCGLCGACQERKEAFRDSGGDDPTEYAA